MLTVKQVCRVSRSFLSTDQYGICTESTTLSARSNNRIRFAEYSRYNNNILLSYHDVKRLGSCSAPSRSFDRSHWFSEGEYVRRERGANA